LKGAKSTQAASKRRLVRLEGGDIFLLSLSGMGFLLELSPGFCDLSEVLEMNVDWFVGREIVAERAKEQGNKLVEGVSEDW
jgi:hypothetical protein